MKDRSRLIEEARGVCASTHVPVAILCAIIETESNWNRYATRYEPLFNYETTPEKFAKLNRITVQTEKQMQKMSWGLGQVMGATARAIGYSGPLPALCETLENMYWTCKYLKQKLDKYDSLDEVISAYNAGSAKRYPKFNASDKDVFMNQKYVDKVTAALANY